MAGGDRVLVKDQTLGEFNGIYDYNGAAAAMTRSSDADTAVELEGAVIFVTEGTANADKGFVQTRFLFVSKKADRANRLSFLPLKILQ